MKLWKRKSSDFLCENCNLLFSILIEFLKTFSLAGPSHPFQYFGTLTCRCYLDKNFINSERASLQGPHTKYQKDQCKIETKCGNKYHFQARFNFPNLRCPFKIANVKISIWVINNHYFGFFNFGPSNLPKNRF